MSMPLSLGFFGLFGRSPALRDFDRALRAVDLHPKLVPEAVKLTALKLLGEETRGRDISPTAQEAGASLLAYCMLGADAFAEANGSDLTAAVERRMEEALQTGDSLDAKLILLALHAKVVQPSVIEAFELESAE